MDTMKIGLIVMTTLAAISSATLLWLIKHPKTPRALDFVVGVQLIMFAAFFLGLLGDLRGLLPDGSEVKAGYDVALLIIPFFTAGLGTNILSHVVLSHRDYENTLSSTEIGRRILHWITILCGLVFPPILMAYAIWQAQKS